MKIRLSIFTKLLVTILPLICLPIAMVGFFSFQASVNRVDRLVRHEQKVKAEALANEISDIFFYTQLDLALIASLPILEDYNNSRLFGLQAATEFNQNAIQRLFMNFIERAGHYYQIRYVDHLGQEVIKKHRDVSVIELQDQSVSSLFKTTRSMAKDDMYVSPIVYSSSCKGDVIHFAKVVYSGLGEFDGVVVIDLDYGQINLKVNKMHIGSGGYAFLIDDLGRVIAHPKISRYTSGVNNDYPPSLRALIQKMIGGKTGWMQYAYGGKKMGAAYAPIPIMKWAIGITIPISEFKKEAFAIRNRVIQTVAIVLFFAVMAVLALSYYMIKPVRALVEATRRIAGGDLQHEIPVHARDELGDLTIAFNRMVKNLAHTQNELIRSEKLISMGRLSAGVAHEVRNPLNAMKGAIEYLHRRCGDNLIVREYTQLVSEEIDRLSQFVSDFLCFAKELPPKPEPTDINALISSAVNLHKEPAQQRSIRFHEKLSPDLPLTWIDAGQMTQVLMNILINAMDALPKGGDITISSSWAPQGGTSEDMQRVRVTVEDNGIGISADQLKNIFDPFFSTKDNGTGLGLPISLGIVENHGGRIRVTSQEGRGTCVMLEWPLYANVPAEPLGFDDENNTGH